MKLEGPIKVLIIDDSAVFRQVLAVQLGRHADLRVVGGAGDAYEARDQILKFHPDVIILDLQLPKVDGLVLLRKLRVNYPVPVIVCSATTTRDGPRAIRAIEFGALDVVIKPTQGGAEALRTLGDDLAERIRIAHTDARPVPRPPTGDGRHATTFKTAGLFPGRFVVAIGASTGGTEAIRAVLSPAPADFPPVVIVQHMPAGFTRSFAERLDGLSALRVTEATDGEALISGQALVARGDTQMTVQRNGTGWRVRYGDKTPVNRHCPSVDVLFRSVAEAAGPNGVGILLTGMGADGAHGLLAMREHGATTIAQTAITCVVYGMPKAAIELGAVQFTARPEDVSSVVLRALVAKQRTGVGVG